MAVVFDAVSSSNPSGTSNLSWTHVLGALGSTGLIIVIVETENGTNNITGATFNGVVMTQVITDGHASSNGSFVAIYELHGVNVPAAGSYTVTATFSAFDGSTNSRVAGAMSFGGVKNQVAEASTSINASSTSPLSKAITTLTSNALIIAGHGNQNANVPTFTTGEITKFDAIPSSGEASICTGAYRLATTAGSNTTSLTVNNPEDEVLVLASFEAARTGQFLSPSSKYW